MVIKAEVVAEEVQARDGIEYVQLTCREIATEPLLQMFDYGLRQDELQHKAKLVGKLVELHVKTIRAIFAGRPQFSGRLVVAAAK